MRRSQIFLLLLALGPLLAACAKTEGKTGLYEWRRVAEAAAFAPGYNYPVFVSGGEMFAFNGGVWSSKDGRAWTKTELPALDFNSAYQKYVQFDEAVYALGTMRGNYTNFQLTSKITRTRDFKTWETVAEKSNLPARVFYGAAVFKGRIWLVGGWDGKNYHHDVWSSADGVDWRRVAEKTAWSPRIAPRLVVFKDRLWLLGGGVIDGDAKNNPNSENEFWSSADGVAWEQAATGQSKPLGGTPVVYDNRLWLVGANRGDGDFSSAVYVSEDGRNWSRQSAPWSPRGGVSVWVFDGRLWMTGGKYSFSENGAIRFVYSNDVWTMGRGGR
jgi:hypothetical protein